MPLFITRRPGESFDLIWPDDTQRTVVVESTGSFFTTISVDGGKPDTITQFMRRLVGVPGHSAIAELRASREKTRVSNQVTIIVDAPREVRVLRDNAKCREAKQ